MGDILYHIENVDYQPINWDYTAKWLKNCIEKEEKVCGELNYIIGSDTYLLEINQRYLKHNTFTDVITFNYVEGNRISGDIFISIDRIKENAEQFEVTVEKEFLRVLVHGLLHLLDYDDKTSDGVQEIRAKEDFYLNLHSKK